ncbi:VWA domain-containing protein [Streptomyces triticagri]|uniref:VWA domain-containing protein n=1 Tax=Streptomyces triticagri TaxID=2293568 RepID=A0A372M2P6_9ACTN|nr:VWA domain-containing protein [Streptomyces triticagri]RFU85188.1 VWA domain-containing protein [Streptomyces triticagri]
MAANTHFQPTPPALSEDEWATARWEDDGGPVHEPRPATHTREWLRIAAALAERLPELAGRDDVIVTCKPGTRSGAPAAFFPVTAELEIDAALFAPHNPRTINPARYGDEQRYPVAWGAFIHEAAHAAHSKWRTPTHLRGTALAQAAEVLEESRVERAHVARRPDDLRYLRACASTLVLAELNCQTPADRWQAAYAAGLILGRRDAGILKPDETEPLEKAVAKILGEDLLQTLADIWNAAHHTADHDDEGMLAHGRAWCEALGADQAKPPPRLKGDDGGNLAEAIGKAMTNVDEHEAAEAAIDAIRTEQQRAKADKAARERQAGATADKVFKRGGTYAPRPRPDGKPPLRPVTRTRPPTPGERAAAGKLARALRAAAYRERIVTVTTSAAPPGRLNMRGALARDAQRAAGAIPTAQPWVHTQRRQAPSPPLRVGIAVDVSSSMRAATAPMASAAWIFARAVALTDPESAAATVAYDRGLTAITAPGRNPDRVTEFAARGGGHCLAEAIDALTAGLDLTKPGRGRLLVVASDGIYSPADAVRAADRIRHLTNDGCAVLWLAFKPDPFPLPHTTLVELDHPAHAVDAIARAAKKAVKATTPIT